MNWDLWDMWATDAQLFGSRVYRTKDAVWTVDEGPNGEVLVNPYLGADRVTRDFYSGSNYTVTQRLSMLTTRQPWWGGAQPWDTIVGWNGRAYANSAARNHSPGRCGNAFILTFDADPSYARSEYWFQTELEALITNPSPCTDTHPDAVAWTAMDVYARECPTGGGSCTTRLAHSVYRPSGTWDPPANQCDTTTPMAKYIPPAGKMPVWFDVVVAAGVGHVPSAAKIRIERWW